jgi:hypothetical protein
MANGTRVYYNLIVFHRNGAVPQLMEIVGELESVVSKCNWSSNRKQPMFKSVVL